MAYTVKQVAAMSGVSVRALHFYHETGLLKPAHRGANGYRFYEDPQLLTLQLILFYRELGFELKQIKQILGRADFEKVPALQSHRKVLQKSVARTHKLIETIDKTILHLKGKKKMKSKEMFAGFSVAAGDDRFGEQTQLGDGPIDCKVSAQDTAGAMCVFESTGRSGWPRHLHYDQDEWIYVIDGEFDFQMGDRVEAIDKNAIQGKQHQAGRRAPSLSLPPLPELQRRWKIWNETHKRFRVRPGESISCRARLPMCGPASASSRAKSLMCTNLPARWRNSSARRPSGKARHPVRMWSTALTRRNRLTPFAGYSDPRDACSRAAAHCWDEYLVRETRAV